MATSFKKLARLGGNHFSFFEQLINDVSYLTGTMHLGRYNLFIASASRFYGTANYSIF